MSTDSESSVLGATDHNIDSPLAEDSNDDQDKADSVTTYTPVSESPNLLGEGNEASTAATGHISPRLELKKTKVSQTQTTAQSCPMCKASVDLTKTQVYTSVYPAQRHHIPVQQPRMTNTPVVYHEQLPPVVGHQVPVVHHHYPPPSVTFPSVVKSTAYHQTPVVYHANNRVYVNPLPQLTLGTVVRTTERQPLWYCPCAHTEKVRYGRVVGYEYIDTPSEAPGAL